MAKALSLYSNNDHPILLKTAFIRAVIHNDIADFNILSRQLQNTNRSEDDKSAPRSLIVPESLKSTLNNLLDVAAEANNLELFDGLIKLGAKPVHNPMRRSAYYWAFKHGNGKIIDRICNLYDDRSLDQLHDLRLNAYHYYSLDEEHSKEKLQRLYNQLLNYYSSSISRDDKKIALNRDLRAYGLNIARNATTNPKNAPDTKIEITLTSATSANVLACADVASSPYERLLSALEQQDYVAVKALRREYLNELIDAIIDHNNVSLLSLLHLTDTEKFNYLKRLIDQAYYEQQTPQNTSIKIEVDHDERDQKYAASPTPVTLIVNSNSACKRLEKILSHSENFSKLLQAIFSKNDKSLLRTLIYLLALKERGLANYFDPIPILIERLSSSTQSVLTREFLLYSKTQLSISFDTTQHRALISPFEISCIADYPTHPPRINILSYLTIIDAIKLGRVTKNLHGIVRLTNYSRPTRLIDNLAVIASLTNDTQNQIHSYRQQHKLSSSKWPLGISASLLLLSLALLTLYLITSDQINDGIATAREKFSETTDTLMQLTCDVVFAWFLNDNMQFTENLETYNTCEFGRIITPGRYSQASLNVTNELNHFFSSNCYEAAKNLCAATYDKQQQRILSGVFSISSGISAVVFFIFTAVRYCFAGREGEYLSYPISQPITARLEAITREFKLESSCIGHLDRSLKQHKGALETKLTAARDNLKTSARLVIRSSPFMSITAAPKTTPTSQASVDAKTQVATLESVHIEMPRLRYNSK